MNRPSRMTMAVMIAFSSMIAFASAFAQTFVPSMPPAVRGHNSIFAFALP